MVDKTLKELVEEYKNTPSDINEHIQTLMDLARGLDVIEFGTRNGVSTAALLFASKSFTAYDIEPRQTGLEKYGLNFIQADDLEIPQVKCDMLFIDTHHSYQQLWEELKRHAEGAKKYLVMHDTASIFAFNDQQHPEGKTSHLPLAATKKHGLVPAIEDFLTTVEGMNWRVEMFYENNNGLTILHRVK